MNKLFAPSIKLMSNLKYPQKFIFISLIFSFMILGLISNIVFNINQKIEISKTEIPGINYIKPTMKLMIDIQKHRELSYLYLSGFQNSKDKMLKIEKEIDSEINIFNKINNKYKEELNIKKSWIKIKKKWNYIKSQSLKMSSQESFEEHTKLINEILFLIGDLQRTFKLILDPDVGTSVVTVRLPKLIEYISEAKGIGLGLAVNKNLNYMQNTKLLMLSGTILFNSKSIFAEVQGNFKDYPDLIRHINLSIQNSSEDIEFFTQEIKKLLNDKNLGFSLDRYVQTGTKAVDSTFILFNRSINALEELIKERIKRLIINKILLLSLFVLVLLTVAYFFAGLYLSIMNTVSQLKNASDEIANGNFETKIDIKTKDELASIEIAINNMTEKLYENYELKKKFLTALAHDMRSPLIAEQSVLEDIVNEKFGTSLNNYKDFLTETITTNEELLGLINNTLDMYHIESDKFKLNKQLTYIENIINDSIRSIKYLAVKKNSKFIINIEKNMPLLLINKDEIRRVIINLITNSIKHNSKGCQITVEAKKFEDKIQVSVGDNGRGIPENNRAQIFQKYPTEKSKVGTGLGLYLSMQFINDHNGKIWFETELNKGTTFYFTLPI